MKNFISNFCKLLIVIMLISVYSCEDVEPEIYNGQTFVSYIEQPQSISVTENASSRLVEIGLTSPFGSDTQINLVVTNGTAIEGVDFNLSNSTVTIPAGELIGSFSILPIDNNVFNASKTFSIELSSANTLVANGNANEASYIKNVTIVNDDCPTQSSLWWGNLSVEDVGFGTLSGVGSANSDGDCDVLVVDSDLPNGGAGAVPFELFLTPNSPGATSGTVNVPDQTYCTACSAGLDAIYSASGTYDETTQTIILFYSLDRTDGANFWTGTNIITVP